LGMSKNNKKLVFILIFAAFLTVLYLALTRDKYSANGFVGKWNSSKLETPLYLYDNGEWEIKTERGTVLQYGVWEYKNKKIIWSFKRGTQVDHDVNSVLLSTPQEFQLLESDRTITTFRRIE